MQRRKRHTMDKWIHGMTFLQTFESIRNRNERLDFRDFFKKVLDR